MYPSAKGYNKHAKFALDSIVYVEYSIIESILIWECVISIRPISNQLAFSMIAFEKPVCLTGLVQRNKPVKFALDLIVYFEYSIIESILIRKYVTLIRPISNQLALTMIDVDVLSRIRKVWCNFAVFCAGFYEISFLFRRPILHFLQN